MRIWIRKLENRGGGKIYKYLEVKVKAREVGRADDYDTSSRNYRRCRSIDSAREGIATR